MGTRIQIRRGTSAEWAAANPVLADGEIGFDKTLDVFKVGDGVSTWSTLPKFINETTADGKYQTPAAADAKYLTPAAGNASYDSLGAASQALATATSRAVALTIALGG